MEKWKHIIYPFFVEVYATAATPFAQTWRWKWGNTFFGSRFLFIVFLAHPRKNTSTWQNFVRLRIPNLVRISISLAIASPSSCSSDQNWSYHEKKCLVMNMGVLGFLGRSFFCNLLTYHFHIYWQVFSSGVSFSFGPKPFPRFWPWIKHGSFFGGILLLMFISFSMKFLLTSRWKIQLESESLHESCRASLEIWQTWKISTKMIPGILTTSSSFGSSKNMEAKKSTPKWRVAHPFFTHLHCLGFQNVNFPCFGSARFAAFIRLFNSNFTARALHTRQQENHRENGGKTLGMEGPFIINPIYTLEYSRYLLGIYPFKGLQQGG